MDESKETENGKGKIENEKKKTEKGNQKTEKKGEPEGCSGVAAASGEPAAE
ncbi:MAG: hypothetical protein ACE5H2_06730 [Terriglobia bacterium]